MKNGLKCPEVLAKIGQKSKEWHESLTEEERIELAKKQKDGWTESARESHRKHMSEYNKSFKMKDKLILKYGNEIGLQKYEEWKSKISNSVKNNSDLQVKSKAVIALQKKTPTWPLYQKRKAEALHLRSMLRKQLITEDEFNHMYEALKVELKKLNETVKLEVLEIERDNG